MKPSKQQIDELLTRGVEKVIEGDILKKKLLSGEKLRIKHGVDPTGRDLHLGYSVVYRKLREFQKLGHQVIFLIGDFTGRFGDPTDKDTARKLRSGKEVRDMAKEYIKQLSKILDIKKVEVRYNSEWYDNWSGEDMLRLESKFTVDQMLKRDMFEKRHKDGKDIRYHEPVYPMLQGWDSLELKADVTVIGTDQTFNELQARKLQEQEGQKPQDLMIVPLLVGTDGTMKMSQSLGNDIGLAETPDSQFGKIMSIPDQAVNSYFELCTDVPLDEIKKIIKGNPRDAKMRLAHEVVELYHGKAAAKKAEEQFVKTFQKKEVPEKVRELRIMNHELGIVDLLVKAKLAGSKGEARRVVEQGGVRVEGKTIKDANTTVTLTKKGVLIQKGKRYFVRVYGA